MDTKNIILNAAFELFEEKPVSAVSMQQIADRAHVSRKTLYNHFADKYEIMHQCYSNYVDTHILSCFDGTNYRAVNELIQTFIFGHRQFIKHVSSVEGADSFWSFLKDYSFRFMKNVCLSSTGKDALDDKEHMTLVFFIEGGVGLIRQILEGKCSMKPDIALEIIMEQVPYMQHAKADTPGS